MKRAIRKVLLFFILFSLVDFLSKPLFMSLLANAKPSAMKNMYDISVNCNKDIIVLGSSRAMHHYDSRIIEDSLHMSCLNCGAMSNGIVLMYGRYKLLTRHHNPKIIIYDVHPPFDLTVGDNSKYIPTLRPFADDENIKNLFDKIDKKENWKVHSNLYRFNSLLPELLAVNVRGDNCLFNGYAPLFNTKEFAPPVRQKSFKSGEQKRIVYDSLKISLFRDIIMDCKKRNIKLIFAISPSYKLYLSRQAIPLFRLCKDNNIPVFCYEEKDFPVNEKKYYYDSYHLNDVGAQLFTKKFVSDLKKLQY